MSLKSLGFALLFTASIPAIASAQEVSAVENEAVADIVVTALRRDTTLQKTPISISAISGDTLNKVGATSINDYFRQVPNLQVEGNAPAARRITIRGVRSTGESTVGLYFDETPLTGPAGVAADAGLTNPDINLFDVERVEVLRGPQGTLFGSGSMGGTVRMIYNKPAATEIAGTVEAQGTVTKDGQPGFYVKGMMNLPIARDTLALRVVAYKENRGGFIDVPGLNRNNVNDVKSYGGRAMLRFTPDDRLAINLSASYQDNKLGGPTNYNTALGAYNAQAEAIGPGSDRLQLYNAAVTYKLPFDATLTATVSHYDWKILRNIDYTTALRSLRTNATSCRNYIGVAACNSSQLATYTAYADSLLPSLLHQPWDLKAWVYEGRISGSVADDLLSYTLGVYHDSRKDHAESQVGKADVNGDLIEPIIFASRRVVETDVKQTAFFGEVSVKPFEALTLTGGARRFSYDKRVFGQVLISNFVTQSYAGPATTADASSKGWVYKLNASFQLDPNIMLYGTASSGFRPGGANNIPGIASTLVVYQPDSLWNYELGAKTQLFDRLLTLNTAIYRIDWKDMQVSGRSATGVFSYLTNAGKARIEGAEIEAVLTPMRGLSLNSALGFVDAKLSEDQLNPGLAATGSTGLKGDRIPNVPKFTFAGGIDYRWDVNDRVRATVNVNFTHSAGSYSEFRPTYVYYERNSAYQNLGARLGVEFDRSLTIQFFVQNLLNEKDPILLTSNATDVESALTLQPRTFGVMARKTF